MSPITNASATLAKGTPLAVTSPNFLGALSLRAIA